MPSPNACPTPTSPTPSPTTPTREQTPLSPSSPHPTTKPSQSQSPPPTTPLPPVTTPTIAPIATANSPTPISPHSASPLPSSPAQLPHPTDSPQDLLRRSVFLSSRSRHEDALHAATAAITLLQHQLQQKSHPSSTTSDPTSPSDAVAASPALSPYLVQLGTVHAALQNLPEAEQTLRRAVLLTPCAPAALTALAAALKAGDPICLPECLDLLRRAHAASQQQQQQESSSASSASTAIHRFDPNNNPAFSLLPPHDATTKLAAILTDVGVRLKVASLPASAIDHYREALEVSPSYAHALYNLAVAYADSANTASARECYEKCLKLNPTHVEAWCNLGVLHRNDGHNDLAMQAYERALSCNPNFDLAKSNLAVALCEKATVVKATDRKAAKRFYKRALALTPTFSDAYYNLGVLYAESGKLERALVSYNLAIQFNPRSTEALNNLGVVYKELGNMEKALEFYKKALQYDKQHHQTHNNIAVVYTLMGNVDIAAEHLKLANVLSPQYAEAYNNIGVLLRDQGDINSAIWHYERCSELDPRADMAAQNRLHALCYSEKWTKAQVFEQHQMWGDAFQRRMDNEIEVAVNGAQTGNPVAEHLLKCLKNPPRPHPDILRGPGTSRPLRVGYVSPDFFTHSVSYFAEVLLRKFDRDGFEVFAYANVAQPDAKTERFRFLLGKNWRNIWGLTASAVGSLIVDDKIDILVELAGHTANNRLDVMALRLAPVQVTWIGYPNTTGLSTIHYRVTDGTVDPVNTSQQFTEKLWRLPDVFLCYTPAPDAPEELSEPPLATSGGIVTYGSFNVLAKMQGRTIKLWADILRRVPNSRLLLKAKPFGANGAKQRMEQLFEKEGIGAERLDLVPLIPSTRSHLQAYANVDIGLDPFPYAGTTTTCEALYMGVPVITLGSPPERGDHAHNVGVTLMSAVGHGDLVAMTEQEYVEKAVSLGGDLERLKRIRRHLRERMMTSALGDGERYMHNVERMFCNMWRERGGSVASDGVAEGNGAVRMGDVSEGCEMGDDSVESGTVCRTVSEVSDDRSDGSPQLDEVVDDEVEEDDANVKAVDEDGTGKKER